jgi:hypothetical protein
MEIKIEQDELLQRTLQCKTWSGSFLTRIFNRTGVPGFEIGSLGSAGFIKYRDKFFVVTASHVLKIIPIENRLTDVVIPYQYDNGTKILTLIKHADDKESDISVLEISPESARFMERENNKCFLDSSLIDEDPIGYFEKISNVVFLHGITGQETNIDYKDFVVDMTTTPYTTFIHSVDEASNRIVLLADREGINEIGEQGVKLPVFNGMSGSFAYSYRREDSENPFRLLGILANGNREAGYLWVIPFNEVTDLIEREFF